MDLELRVSQDGRCRILRQLSEVVSLIDQAIERRVLLFGSVPPEARDLDLLARPEELDRIRTALSGAGWTSHGHTWASFLDCGALVVDLIPASSWQLPEAASAELFRTATPWMGAGEMCVPDPPHMLLIMARRMAGGTSLDGKRKKRVDDALTADPSAWERAARLAPAWGATLALDRMRDVYASGSGRLDRTTRLRARAQLQGPGASVAGVALSLPSLIRRPKIVAFSGLDGSGKSTQVKALADTLEVLGVETETHWSRLAFDPVLLRIGTPAKRILGWFRRGGRGGRSTPAAPSSDELGAELRDSSSLVNSIWAFIVGTVNVLSLRKAVRRRRGGPTVLIIDRFVLDSIVELEYRYGRGADLALHERWMRLIAPKTLRSYLLEVPPGDALARKKDEFDLSSLTLHADGYAKRWKRFSYVRLDGTRPAEELCSRIAQDVWGSL